MKLTISYNSNSFNLELDSSIEVENLKALIEVEFDLPKESQILTYQQTELSEDKKSLSDYSIEDNSVLILQKKYQPTISTGRNVNTANSAPKASNYQQNIPNARINPAAIEEMRLRVLSDNNLYRQLEMINPELPKAARENPSRFSELMSELEQQRYNSELQRMMDLEALNADPFNVEAQKRIEDEIKKQNILKNMEDALEHNPESFASVSMLYIDTEVNNHHIKAFVDSGAQATIMNTSCAERCGLMRLLDTRFSGFAQGVGVAKILGRIHNAVIKVGNQHLVCSFTVMENQNVELLFGLDMLKRHQACIDLKKDALVINDEVIPFLPEHLIPKMDVITDNNHLDSLKAQNELESKKKTKYEEFSDKIKNLSNQVASGSKKDTNPFSSLAENDSSLLTSPINKGSSVTDIKPFSGSGRSISSSENSGIVPPPRPDESVYRHSLDVSSNSSTEVQSNNYSTPLAGVNTESSLPSGLQNHPVSKYPPATIEMLISLGVTREKAIAALDAANGNPDVAAGFLFD
ncbi:DNA damage-inducible protein 1 [Smittium mucronatum]|uniref:DNA damage-inducible protein 1 n=1 Tax=Smittium mucronatum TaxID=133383 RepID=A0A1R0H6G6_9FUNG|nr:DNA damage-inducible protein 1 [Smittium mucronatum]